MKHSFLRLLALILCCALLTGCSFSGKDLPLPTKGDSLLEGLTPYSKMVYTRPDMDALEQILADALEAAAGKDLPKIIRSIYEFYDAYDLFFTNYSLADLRYSADLTDTYWQEESDFCTANSPRVDAMLEELYYGLAKSPCLPQLESANYFGPGYFDSYQGENNWDTTFTAMMEEESALVSRYYELSSLGAEYETGTDAYFAAVYDEMARLLVDLVSLRQEMADYWGYDSYNDFATDFYYYRDYTVSESRAYLQEIRQELTEIYRQVIGSGLWDQVLSSTGEADTYAYVERMAENMGGMVLESFRVMDGLGLYDIGYGENKYPSSFEVYLTSYYVPFVFMSPTGNTYDHLVFTHEFGHFCTDYAAYGSYAGVDVLEVFSQGMEYLSLCYTGADGNLIRTKMADSLCLYVEQAAYAEFEMAMYELSPEELTAENLLELYERIGNDFGFDSYEFDPREFVTVTHYYTNPLYVISYIVSNDAAMQLYQLEQENTGAGLECFEENLTTQEYWFLAFLESAGLESPFTPGRIRQVRAIFEEILG